MNISESTRLTLELFPELMWDLPTGRLHRESGLGLTLQQQEKEIIVHMLEECQGNKSLAARKMQIHRSALYRKLEKYGIDVESTPLSE
jgi:DNA-binding NtrC family response regulator